MAVLLKSRTRAKSGPGGLPLRSNRESPAVEGWGDENIKGDSLLERDALRGGWPLVPKSVVIRMGALSCVVAVFGVVPCA